MSSDPTLVLRDIHAVAAPSWWPPAPGWWLVGVAVLTVLAGFLWRHWRRRRRHARIADIFDQAIAAAPSRPQAVAAMSELLRRAARLHDPQADRLQGDAWLVMLDRGLEPAVFNTPQGRLLLDAAFRPDVHADEVQALQRIARLRFILWMMQR